jgi:hypothetical protein
MILEYGEKAGPSPMGEKKTIPDTGLSTGLNRVVRGVTTHNRAHFEYFVFSFNARQQYSLQHHTNGFNRYYIRYYIDLDAFHYFIIII